MLIINMQNSFQKKYSGLDELINLEEMNNYNELIVCQSLKQKNHPKQIVDFGAGIGKNLILIAKKI